MEARSHELKYGCVLLIREARLKMPAPRSATPKRSAAKNSH